MTNTDDFLAKVKRIKIQADAVRLPSGHTKLEEHGVTVQHLRTDQYPYQRNITSVAWKLGLYYFVGLFDQVAAMFIGVISLTTLPFIGLFIGFLLLCVQVLDSFLIWPGI